MSDPVGVRGGPSFGERRLAEETRERFLREIVARVPLDRLAAVHLFRPIRQGGIESGVAVIAAEQPPAALSDATPVAPEPPVAEPAAASRAAGAPAGESRVGATSGAEPAAGEARVGEAGVAAAAVAPPDVEVPAAEVEPGADTIDEPACDPTDAAAGSPVASADEREAETEAETEAAAESEPVPDAPESEGEGGGELRADAEPFAGPAPDAEAPAPEPRPTRHTVFTARYRLAVKGPDRGKWDVEVVEEADAPLITVEAVVRGVQRRAGDEADPERLDAAGVARLVGARPP
jgi:hypothetical protein